MTVQTKPKLFLNEKDKNLTNNPITSITTPSLSYPKFLKSFALYPHNVNYNHIFLSGIIFGSHTHLQTDVQADIQCVVRVSV